MRFFWIIPIFLSACASVNGAGQNAPAMQTQEGLAVRTLKVGTCGLYVWKADASKDFVLFAGEGDIAVLREGTETPLTANGPISDVRNLSFMDAAGRAVKLRLADEEQVESGVRYKSGSLTMVTDEGWDQYSSVVGLYVCQLLKPT